jgi:hypothetical protein
MSETNIEVTVYDRASTTASVSVAQVEAYLRRSACIVKHIRSYGLREPYKSDNITHIVNMIADAELRPPSFVLADIAREPAP